MTTTQHTNRDAKLIEGASAIAPTLADLDQLATTGTTIGWLRGDSLTIGHIVKVAETGTSKIDGLPVEAATYTLHNHRGANGRGANGPGFVLARTRYHGTDVDEFVAAGLLLESSKLAAR